ncbi:GlcG/HbpS family heme-binding protein [Saccharopolyspora spinosa]|uniref:Uncharacterized protein GlcG (DUF336 family) n=1 Tax=Saccharopolyspora spinosa TaxID=60894 RepID=A0A2N3Y6E9_SACSN|nr:heme-binding protein [Saccharopolyspora spinosa]PKW18490.1 uncharacterized protein GlcG (DUF336 family) [Saccharopolyspora spinosa]
MSEDLLSTTVETATLAGAQRGITAAMARARALGIAVTVAVVDRGGHLLALARDETANLVSLDLAIGKAHTALVMQSDTRGIAGLVAPGQELYHLDLALSGRPLVAFAGGLPVGAPAIGAVGVSGGRPEQDEKIASAAVAAWVA